MVHQHVSFPFESFPFEPGTGLGGDRARAVTADLTEEDAVRSLIEAWVRAVGAAELDGVCAGRAKDVVLLDVPQPEEGVRGIEAYRAAWARFLGYVRSGARFKLADLHVEAGEDVA
jgi:ketosteroid isomerase-like protein